VLDRVSGRKKKDKAELLRAMKRKGLEIVILLIQDPRKKRRNEPLSDRVRKKGERGKYLIISTFLCL